MITSLQNEKIKEYTKLNNKKYRDLEGLFIASGDHLVKEASKAGLIKEIFLLEKEDNIYGEVTYVTKEILKKISGLETNPKVLAICYKKNKEEITGNVIMIDDLADPGNLGTIIRSAVAFNYQTIIISNNTVDPYNNKVVRASEGTIFNINLIITSLDEAIKDLKKSSYVKAGKKLNQPNKKHALIIGSENQGIRKNLLELTDYNLKIKMNPKVESLNAGVAASILMHELNNGGDDNQNNN